MAALSRLPAPEQVEHIYRRYARVRIDAIMECYDLLKDVESGKRQLDSVMEIIKNYIEKNAKVAFEDAQEPMVKLGKMRRPINYLSLGTSRGL